MREKLSAAGLGLLVAAVVAVSASFAWITLSRAPEVTGIATTLSGNGSLEIALSKADGSQPEEYDIDENAPAKTDVVSSNLQWGNLVNLSDESYGIDNLALRPAQLNTANLLNSPLWGASYGEDGRITQLDSNYAYAKYKDGSFITSKDLGVRAIATYTTTISEASQAEYVRVRDAVTAAHNAVNTAYGNERSGVAAKFGALGTMISKYAQDKLDNASPGTNLAPYLKDMIPLYETVQGVMEKQKDAYVALANLQSYLHANNTGTEYTPLTWKDLDDNKESYNAQDSKTDSKNGVVSLVGLEGFIKDFGIIEKDINLLHQYKSDYEQNGTAYYWSSWSKTEKLDYPLYHIVADLIDYETMTIDVDDKGTEIRVTSKEDLKAHIGDFLASNGENRNAYVYNGVLKRLEQTAVDETYRINGRAECTISVSYLFATITIKGKAYTKASGASDFSLNYTKATEGKELVPSDQVAEDTYGMVVDFWVRTNHETTKLTLEGATVLDESGEVLRYDGVNRIWGVTGDTEDGTLTRESTTQGGGSCYVYYADTPEDQSRSLRLLEAMKVAFVSASGELLAKGEMDTQNYWAQNGRVTVPMVLDSETKTTYTYTDEKNEEKIGRAITTLQMDEAQRITAIIYLDGTQLTNDMVLAASEIQGQLNLQFGSSENLKTVGDKSLVDKVRSVTATANKTELDYDTATSDEELTAEITLTVEGAEPSEITARFVRAINATQGSREPEMTFNKLEDGTWVSQYKFAAPGTYYLRHVRLDGVDYALENPVSIQVKGFDLKSVGWGETVSEASVRTSDGTYSEKVWVEFATNDESKMPSTVEARFVRTDDGNTVNIPLSRDTKGVWRGTGTFTTSGVYKWEYLVYKTADSETGIYRDMGDSKKTLDLALGLCVGVTDMSGTQTQPYEDGKTYHKDVAVRIYDNAGNTLEGLTGAKLFYSNGGSASNTINTDLTWNELDGCYNGTLPIARAGRYQFAYVSMQGGQTLTKATESPVYTIISPDPPIYDESSQTTYHGDTTQFVPLTNDAQIDGIKILNSASATISAVVYNSETREYYTVNTADVRYAGDSWTVKLPTYERDIGGDKKEQTQDGTWSLVALWLTDCYDAEGTPRESGNPIIWVGSDDVSKNYASTLVDENGSNRPYESKDFSKLSTTVSCSVSVTMTPGTTTLGNKTSTEFMHQFAVKNLGMSVAIRDNTGNEIPSDKIESVKLVVDYTAPADDAYGYKVQGGANKHYDVNLTWDSEQRVWTADSADIWQYVGEYKVQGLTVMVKGNKSLTYAAGTSGVPTAYTIMTKGPDSSNISLEDVKQVTKEFGKSSNNVTGTFLQSYDLSGTNLKVSLKPKDNAGRQYAVLDNVTASLKLTYKNGKTAPNGGYYWTDTSTYENITLNMTAGDGNSVYSAGSTPLLAGTYSAAIEVKVGNNTTTMNLSDISAYSKLPDVTVVGVLPAIGDAFDTNLYKGSDMQYYEVAQRNGQIVSVSNYYSEEENEANVYIKADKVKNDVCNDYLVDYTLPKVTLKLSNAGVKFTEAIVSMGNGTSKFTFNKDNSTSMQEIGTIGKDSWEYQTGTIFGIAQYETVEYETRQELGEQTISNIDFKDEGITYSVTLSRAITIRENNSAPPSLTYVCTESGYTMPDAVRSVDGKAITVVLPVTNTTEKRESQATEPTAWSETGRSTQNLTYYSVDSVTAVEKGSKVLWFDTRRWDATATFTYHLYERTKVTEERTASAQEVLQTYGLVGWNINGTTYQPGETVTITGVTTAIAEIGPIGDPTILGQPTITKFRRTTESDRFVKNETATVEKTGLDYSAGSQAAKDTVLALYAEKKPTGYEWFNATDPKADEHLLVPRVEELTENG